MASIQEYCTILGVAPGAGPLEVKRAFRSKIKQCHPDKSHANPTPTSERARLIIEAYNALRNGVPAEYFYGEYVKSAANSESPRGRGAASRPTRGTYRRANPGAAIFHEVFGADGGRMYQRLREAILRDPRNPELRKWATILGMDMGYGKAGPAPRAQKPPRPSLAHATEEDKETYEDAEYSLRQVVKRYNRQRAHRGRRQWAVEYVRDLNQVLILFRNVVNYHPTASAAALYRIKEIQELVVSVKATIPR